jgi:hypothetical protein
MKNLVLRCICGAAILFSFTVLAKPNESSSVDIDNTTKNNVLKLISTQLLTGYVFPEKAKEVVRKLDELSQSKYFEQFQNGSAFAKALNQQLQQLSQDKHLQVEFSDYAVPTEPSPEEVNKRQEHELAMWRAHNFGFEKIERLPFNIGYFHLSAFGPTSDVGSLLASTMNLLANTDHLIIDLRGNFGGEEQTVSLLASYFLENRTLLLNSYKRQEDKTEQHWSHDYVQGPRYSTDKDVFILIDSETFSAAEDFSYTMKHLKRATLIGETTGGAAHSGDFVQLTPHFSLFLPSGRAISPITKDNWEGKGVFPNISVDARDALNEAQKVILNKLLATEESNARQVRIERRIASLK